MRSRQGVAENHSGREGGREGIEEANRFDGRTDGVAVVVGHVENGFQYHFESAMFCPFYLCPGLQTFKQAEIRYGKVPPGKGNVVISVPHLARQRRAAGWLAG